MASPDLGIDADLNGAVPFAADSEWNTPVADAPLLWDSDAIIGAIGAGSGLHPDFGSGTYGGTVIGIPYVVVPYDQPLVPFLDSVYGAEADPGPFPIPDDAPVQGEGATGYNDHHLIVLQLDQQGNLAKEYDFFQVSQTSDGTWQGYSASFDLTGGDDQRPMGWTSANAAGLPEFPGLVTYDQVQEAIAAGGANGVIPHALAFTLNAWNIGSALFGAAEHATGGTGPAGFGMRFRLRADYQINPNLPVEDQVILNTLKVYGMILVDNGANFFLSGAPDPRWNNADLHLLQSAVTGTDFQVVDTTGLTPPQPITVGSGPDAIVLQLAETPYQGNVQFTLSIDGNQVGGVQTVTALAAQGQAQSFTFLGDWGTTQHKVSIRVLNPLADGAGQRGLLLQGASYDGTAVSASAADLSATGATSFGIGSVPVVGAGADTLVLHLCEAAYQGDAQFTVSVDGQQVGGVQTVTMPLSSGRTEDFKVLGNWGGGQHSVVVNFVNGFADSGGSRNLFVWGMSYDGVEYSGNVQNLYGGGVGSFLVGSAAPVGSGPDTLVLHVCEDAYRGDAQFTVSVDGQQVGEVLSATLLRASGHTQDVTLQGNWSGGQHQVVVNFLNGLSDSGGSRDLFIWGMNYDGVEYAGNAANLYGGGAASFAISGGNTVGSGADTLVLHVCEDAWQGDAQFTVSVDGKQVGGVLSAAALRSGGHTQDVKVLGNWGGGQHQVVVNFLNGGGDATGARHLFVWGMNYDGTEYASNLMNMYSTEAASFLVGSAAPVGSGPDTLVLHLCEDAYRGDAQFTVSVDGQQVGGVLTAQMFRLTGRTQDVTLQGNWGGGQHSVTVNFLNGLADSSGSRNLFVWGMSYDGVAYAGNMANLYGGGTASFTVGSAAQPAAAQPAAAQASAASSSAASSSAASSATPLSDTTAAISAATLAAGAAAPSFLSHDAAMTSSGTTSALPASDGTAAPILAGSDAGTLADLASSADLAASGLALPDPAQSAAAYAYASPDTPSAGGVAPLALSTDPTLLPTSSSGAQTQLAS